MVGLKINLNPYIPDWEIYSGEDLGKKFSDGIAIIRDRHGSVNILKIFAGIHTHCRTNGGKEVGTETGSLTMVLESSSVSP